MTKSALRKLYLQKRQALSETEYLHLSRLLCEQFFAAANLSFIKVIHVFLPIREKKEPDTWLIIDRIRREYPHIRLSIPKISATGTLENIYFEGLHQLEENNWGIAEPKYGVPTPTEKIDMVLVPLLCTDWHGNRIGYGKGFYDSFLSTCKKGCEKTGISFFDPVDTIEDINEFDVPITSVITPGGIITF